MVALGIVQRALGLVWRHFQSAASEPDTPEGRFPRCGSAALRIGMTLMRGRNRRKLKSSREERRFVAPRGGVVVEAPPTLP
jgi:hypothetical protein